MLRVFHRALMLIDLIGQLFFAASANLITFHYALRWQFQHLGLLLMLNFISSVNIQIINHAFRLVKADFSWLIKRLAINRSTPCYTPDLALCSITAAFLLI